MAAKKEPEEVVNTATGEIVSIDEATGMDYVPKSWEDMEAFFENEGGILTFEGSPYQVIDKARLVDIPFMIADVRIWHSNEFDTDVASICVLTKDQIDGKDHFVINDGSTGIFEQVKGMVERSGRKAGIFCPNGLRASEYEKETTDPFEGTTKKIKATTYYVQ